MNLQSLRGNAVTHLNNMTEPDNQDDGYAHSRIYMGQRLMLLCHRHALALIDLADGNGVKLRIEPLEIEDFGSECRACMAADPEPSPIVTH
jgi:hypothetical protein